jgi:hypothetical protein
VRVLSLSQVGSKQGGGGSTLKTAQLVIKKFKFFKWYRIFRRSGATAQEAALNADTMVNVHHQFELAFSKPEDLDWLENDLRENGHTWLRRHEVMTANHLKAHGRQIPWWTERAVG